MFLNIIVFNNLSIVSENREQVHDEFKDLLGNQKPIDEVHNLTLALFIEVWEQELQQAGKKLSNQEQNKKVLEEEITRLVELASSPNTSIRVRERYEQQIDSIAQQIEEINEKINNPINFDIPYRTAGEKIFGMLKSPYKIWTSADIEQKQKLFYFIFEENIEYQPGIGFRTTKKCLPIRLFEEITTSDSVDVEMAGIEPACIKEIL